MKPARLFPLMVLLLCWLDVAITPVHAQLLVNPAKGTALWDDATDHDDAVKQNRPLGFTGAFFGDLFTSVDVSVNGNLNFSANVDAGNNSLPDPFQVPRISPLWDDQVIKAGDGGSIIESISAGKYYAVTWKNMETAPGSAARNSFQVVWFGDVLTLNGFAFQPGDLAFSYESIAAGFDDRFSSPGATIGLDKGDYATFTPLPGTDDGLVLTSLNQDLIPTTNNQFVLFRPDGNDSYTASIEHFRSGANVPEPSATFFLLAGCSLFVAFLFARRYRLRRVGTAR